MLELSGESLQYSEGKFQSSILYSDKLQVGGRTFSNPQGRHKLECAVHPDTQKEYILRVINASQL